LTARTAAPRIKPLSSGRLVAAEGPAAGVRRARLAPLVVAALVLATAIGYAVHRSTASSSRGAHTLEPVVGAVVPLRPVITGVAAGDGGVWATSESGGAANPTAAGLLWRIDPRTNRAAPPVAVAGGGQGIALAAGSLWTVSPEGTHRVDPENGRVLARIPAARGSEIEGAGRAVWVGRSRIDPRTNSVAARGDFDGFVSAIGPEGTWARSDVLERIDAQTGRVVATVRRAGFTPNAVALGGGSVWVAYASRTEWETTAVVRIDPKTNRPSGDPVVLHGRVPSALVYVGGSLWLLAHNEEEQGARLTQIDPESGAVVGTPVHLGGGTPALLAASGRTLWVGEDLDQGTVTRVDLR
jgi:hypothetical protein